MTKKEKNPFAPLDRTDLGNPMGSLDRIELAIANVAQTLFPGDRRLSADERARRVQDYEEFRRAARDIMDLVDETERDAVRYAKVDDPTELRTRRKEQIINLLLLACLTCVTNVNARNQRIERLREEIQKKTRPLIARRAKIAPSKTVADLVQHHTRRLWKRNPKRQASGRGTAREIADAVNVDLERGGLKRIGFEAIRKRIQKFR
jgi:hypothetical protein